MLLGRAVFRLPLLYLFNLLLHAGVLLLDLLQLAILIFSCLTVALKLRRKSGHFLLPHAQILIECLQLLLVILAIGGPFQGVTLHAVLFFKLLDRFFELSLQV